MLRALAAADLRARFQGYRVNWKHVREKKGAKEKAHEKSGLKIT
jgi:hypothetical protein